MAIEIQHLNFDLESSGYTPTFTIFKYVGDTLNDYIGLGEHEMISPDITLPTIKEFGETGIYMFSYSDSILTDDIIFEVSINEINKTIRSVLVAPEIRETSNIVRDNNNNITSSETLIKKPNGRIVREKSEALSYSGPFFESHEESLTQ
jgi:hypothetical protein